jgi:tRNA threonylcarbamoyladenosine biosynthesis protein TsaE
LDSVIVAGVDELKKVVLEVKKYDKNIILLKGNLASGKTTFVKEFVKSLGIDEEVSSPTFSIMNSYENRVFHYDIYNEGSQKFLESGLLENLELEGYHLIEWADEKLETILKEYGFSFIMIEITPRNSKREYKICIS